MRTNVIQQEAARGYQSKVKSYLIGIIWGLVVGILFLLLSACILVFSSIPQNNAQVFVFISCGIGSLCCGFASVRKIHKKGLLHGLFAGIIYFIVLYGIGFLSCGQIPLQSNVLIQFVVSILCGSLGGILAVNGSR